VSGGRARMAHINAVPCSKATARCAAAQGCRRCSHSASRRQTSRKDEEGITAVVHTGCCHTAYDQEV
jgi:hypothetical protein